MGSNFVHNFGLGQVCVVESWSVNEYHVLLIESERILLDVGGARFEPVARLEVRLRGKVDELWHNCNLTARLHELDSKILTVVFPVPVAPISLVGSRSYQ